MAERHATAVRRLPFMPWMDGMRGLAVLAVMAYHERLIIPHAALGRWDYSGDLGVDMFFAISGFLITSLLLQEAVAEGIRFGGFYVRRARRLLPALVTLLVVMAVGAVVADNAHQRTLTLEHAGIGLAYAANWVQALTPHNLYDLAHLWSLSAEEQFYAVWPLLLTGIVVLTGRRRPRIVAAVAGVAVLAIVYPEFGALRNWGFARFYYGLDTRGAGLALGALLGAAWTLDVLPRGWRVARGVAAAVATVVLIVLIHDSRILNHLSDDLGIGRIHLAAQEFAIAGVATTVIIWELIESAEHLGHRLLSWAPFRAVGRISYGLYLYNGPIVTLLTPAFTGIGNQWELVAIHVAATFAAATASWWIIERRFRARRRPPAAAEASAR